MQTSNSGNWALITGASSGLGVEFAHLLAARRMNLVLAARGVADMERLADTLRSMHGIDVVVEGIDLSQPGAAAELKRRTDARGLRIETLINNAGFGLHGPLLDADPVRLAQMLQLNMVTLTELTQQYAQDMARRGRGRILLVASLLGFMPAPFYAAYAGTKHYVLALGEALHDELAPAGVTVTVLSPGVTKTAFFEGSGHHVSATLNLMMMAPRPVAEAGIRALMQGRAGVVPGLANKLSAWSARLAPRSVQRRIMQALLA
ncbi:short chain dehydrogenase family protein [Methyloversatilis sp. RAC08]|uniref:SDR family NAD(P)-dependent oxidoreductase n=1 Tax=Methyloversatilis sp. RAC08 TaxID=1842540 RepID=UPI00083D29A2|nr:SDR family oxidoreductase [Methyloversatilis sp. RAC08]AOF81183.1 short chain dehydrogenase family protein [Methyloversatilis sp. RAC08]